LGQIHHWYDYQERCAGSWQAAMRAPVTDGEFGAARGRSRAPELRRNFDIDRGK
jgi:hypothetical protein